MGDAWVNGASPGDSQRIERSLVAGGRDSVDIPAADVIDMTRIFAGLCNNAQISSLFDDYSLPAFGFARGLLGGISMSRDGQRLTGTQYQAPRTARRRHPWGYPYRNATYLCSPQADANPLQAHHPPTRLPDPCVHTSPNRLTRLRRAYAGGDAWLASSWTTLRHPRKSTDKGDDYDIGFRTWNAVEKDGERSRRPAQV